MGDRRANGISAALRSAIVEEMVAVLSASASSDWQSPQTHQWIQIRAVDVLGELSDLASDGRVAKTLVRLLGQEDCSSSLRFAAASALSRVLEKSSTAIDGEQALESLAHLAANCCEHELQVLGRKRRRLDQVAVPSAAIRRVWVRQNPPLDLGDARGRLTFRLRTIGSCLRHINGLNPELNRKRQELVDVLANLSRNVLATTDLDELIRNIALTAKGLESLNVNSE